MKFTSVSNAWLELMILIKVKILAKRNVFSIHKIKNRILCTVPQQERTKFFNHSILKYLSCRKKEEFDLVLEESYCNYRRVVLFPQ